MIIQKTGIFQMSGAYPSYVSKYFVLLRNWKKRCLGFFFDFGRQERKVMRCFTASRGLVNNQCDNVFTEVRTRKLNAECLSNACE